MPIGKQAIKPVRDRFELDCLIAEDYPEVEDTICVELRIPNDLKYLYALQGMYAQMTNIWAWSGDNEARKTRARIVEKAYVETDWGNCMNCEEMLECLQPLFDAIDSRFNALDSAVSLIQSGTDAIGDTLSNNTSVIPPGIEMATAGNICSGSSFVVAFMNSEIRRVYQEAEEGLLDNLIEATVQVIRAIPVIESLPLDEMVDSINLMFANQVADYIIDYDAVKDDLIGALACFITANAGVFDIDIWARWLEFIGSQYPTNRAALLFAAFSPLRQTIVNDILAGIFNRPTLSQWFTMIMAEYEAGSASSIACPTYTCPAAICVTPAILTQTWGDFYPVPAGANITDEGSCYWGMTTTEVTAAPGVFTAQIRADDNQSFTIEDISYPDGISTGTVYYRKNGVDYIAAGTPASIDGVSWFGIGMAAPVANPRIRFKSTRLG